MNKKNNKTSNGNAFWVLLTVLIMALVGGGVYSFLNSKTPVQKTEENVDEVQQSPEVPQAQLSNEVSLVATEKEESAEEEQILKMRFDAGFSKELPARYKK